MFWRRLSGASQLPVIESATKPDSTGAAEVSTNTIEQEQAIEHNKYGSPDTQTKLEFSRCDLHPLYRLREVKIPSFHSADTSKVNALGCTRAGCNRHYDPALGYFQLPAGEPLNLAEQEAKASCEQNHERRYMVVTKINEHFVWACPEAGCWNAVPYQESNGS